ncbi:MAG: helix-turn-helix domain-containing protein [Ramlibacter sp.]|nr:helix-turn-helix domain-containing protein [Ramlibacter sp.]
MDSTNSNASTDGYCGGVSCAVEIGDAIAAVSGRWAIQVLEGIHFSGGASRFRALQRRIGAISSKELSRQLGTLVAHGVVERVAHSPANISYQLTDSGRGLMRHMQALGEWARSMHRLTFPR